MRAFLIVNGVVYALIVVAHVLRMVAEGPRVASDPWFVSATVVAAGLSLWAWLLLRRVGGGRAE